MIGHWFLNLLRNVKLRQIPPAKTAGKNCKSSSSIGQHNMNSNVASANTSGNCRSPQGATRKLPIASYWIKREDLERDQKTTLTMLKMSILKRTMKKATCDQRNLCFLENVAIEERGSHIMFHWFETPADLMHYLYYAQKAGRKFFSEYQLRVYNRLVLM